MIGLIGGRDFLLVFDSGGRDFFRGLSIFIGMGVTILSLKLDKNRDPPIGSSKKSRPPLTGSRKKSRLPPYLRLIFNSIFAIESLIFHFHISKKHSPETLEVGIH